MPGSGGGTQPTGTDGGPASDSGLPSPADSAPVDLAPPPPDLPPPPCNHPEWSRTVDYKAGDIVMYMGKAYIALHPNKSLDPTISTFYWGPYTGCVPPPPAPPALCPELDKLLPEGEVTYKAMFAAPFMGAVPKSVYSYASLCKALVTPSLAGFARSGNATQDKRELAAFFANVAIETAYLTAIDENGHQASDRTYHGRGSLQITSQPIYAVVGQGLGLNLVGMPQLASTETVVWQTGIWYWMHHANPSVGGAQVCHAAIAQSDFGRTVRIIKGNCVSNEQRASQYRKNCMLLGIDPGKTSCP